jgi:hypothetical protein
LALPFTVIESVQFSELNHATKWLLLLIAMQYKGANNGKLVACEKYLRPRAWRSDSATRRCLSELIESGLLCRTRIGTRNVPAWFAIAWKGCDFPPTLHGHLAGEFRPFLPRFLTTAMGATKAPITPAMGASPPIVTPAIGVVRPVSADSLPPRQESIYRLPSEVAQ